MPKPATDLLLENQVMAETALEKQSRFTISAE
ncbi:hypothetical protein KR51_00017820 [Rubidibacter lacunae KORDI 51-2]|uniref:Uncharacterized protein n=1 Tax=Rubidibacter lacunae KORDI 51-2 TaxID=582515 RepID=U5DLW0_9CHRO|nr:hypothetical protein KR51_00017820 [Rubidibacter lacunae KORDI 51-2]